jgi:hypothetical protein
VTKAGIAEATAKLPAEDGERDSAVLADRIGTLANEFDDVASRSRAATVDRLQGTRLPPSAVACHLLNECLDHGHDIAKATGHPWSIRRHRALLAIEGALLPLAAWGRRPWKLARMLTVISPPVARSSDDRPAITS